ncbi:MAG TPA: patatin-like phospholipase family protein [Burkholderiaceae bacterium]|nr:patatin-like phospholipase family protein [Burkholderiaceae bacterium]
MSIESQDALLTQLLRTFLGNLDGAAMALLRRHLEWVAIGAGETLMKQGDPGDSMYLSVSGRLRVYVKNEDGVDQMVREMGRGQVIGEMSLYTEDRRSATVVAIRDSVLVRLAKAEFTSLLASSTQVSIALTRQIIGRLQSREAAAVVAPPVTIGLLPISADVDARDFGLKLAAQLTRIGRVCIVDAAAIDAKFQQPGLAARSDATDADTSRRIALYLNQVEIDHEFVLLIGDALPTPWTERCGRHSDEILLLADAAAPPVLHETELQCLMKRVDRTEAAEILVLLHPTDSEGPRGTRQWLARRPVTDHVHVRPALERDMARLARIQSRTAVGLVLAGGGARGIAHLGVYRALKERGVEIDFVGGTSIGSVMAALIGSDRPVDDVMTIARKAFSGSPTSDFNLIPLLSLIRGRRLRSIIAQAVHELLGHHADIEDLWKNYFCVASNYTQAREDVITRGELLRSMLASIAIPGALPPVLIDGNLLCDGGTFNNFPADVMRARRGVGKVIGVDLGSRKPRSLSLTEIPGNWALLRDRLRPRAQRRYKLPALMSYLLGVNILYSTSRQQESQKLTDLYFNPPLERVGMLQWEKFDSISSQGHAFGAALLDGMTDEQLRPYRLGLAGGG